MKSLFTALLIFLLLAASSFAQKKAKSNDETAYKFTEAAKNDDIHTLAAMLEQGVDINIAPWPGWTAVTAGSTYGKTAAVKFLISKGADVNVRLEKGETVLIQSAQHDKNGDIVKALLAAGASVNAQTQEGLTALMRFAWMGQTEAAEAVLKAGADTKLENTGGYTAFRFAVEYGSTDIVRLLLPFEADLNQGDKDGATPLMWTAWKDRKDALALLIAAKASVDLQDNNGQTALMHAGQNLFQTDVKILLGAKAAVNIKDKKGWTALMHTAASRFRISEVGAHGDGMMNWLGAVGIIDDLAAAGTDINAQNKDGDTALILAVKSQNTHFAENLVKNGADPDIKNFNGKRAVDYVGKEYGRRETWLIGPGMNILKILGTNKIK
jgi:ankyrin repeat protein